MYFRNRLLSSLLTSVSVAAVAAVSDAETLAGSETDALAIVYTDDHFKATTGFNGSVFCVDSGTPANDYDSSPTTETASYFTITSPSPKMILHDDGVLKYNAHNLSLMSESFSDATWTKFESSIDDNGGGGYSDFTGGTNAVQLVESSNTNIHYVFQSLSYVSGVTYNHVCVAKANTRSVLQIVLSSTSSVFGVSGGYANFDLSGGSVSAASANVTGTITSLGGGWYKCEARATAQATVSASYAVAIQNSISAGRASSYAGDGSSGLYIHRSHIHRYPADTTYLKTTSAARYADPIEFNSSGTSLGLLVEPQRTNNALHANAFSNAAWTKSNVSVAQNVASPLGAGTGWTLTASASTGPKELYQSITHSGGTSLSIFAKAGTANYIGLATNNTPGDGVYFNLANGTVGTEVGSTTGTIEAYPDGWYRCTIYQATTAANFMTIDIFTADNQALTWSASGTETILIAFAQSEAGSSATSTIETYGSTVTRAADNISKATSAFPYSNTTGTLYVFANERVFESGKNNTLAELAADASNRTLAYRSASTTFTAASVGGTTMSISPTTAAAPIGDTRLALAYAANDCAAVVDGGTVGTDNTFAAHTAATTLYIGDRSGGTASWNGHIKALLFVPRRVSDADMQTLTSTGALP